MTIEHLDHWAVGQLDGGNPIAHQSFSMKNTLVRFLRDGIDVDLGKMFYRPDLPIIFRLLNWAVLLSTLAWPILLFAGVFMFDSPTNQRKATIFFLLTLVYPFILLALTSAAFKTFNRNKPLGIAFTLWSYLFLAAMMLILFIF